MSTITTYHCLPENIAIEASFYERLKAFVFQYEKILEECAQADGRYLDAEIKRKRSIVESYVYSPGHCEPLTRNQIAKLISASAQTVSNKLDEFDSKCRQILLNGETVDGISADKQLIEDIKGVADSLGSTVTLETFKVKTGIEKLDTKTLSFFRNLLGMKQSDSKQYEPIVSKNKKVNPISESYDTFLSYFREHVINIRYNEDFLPYLKATFEDDLQKAFKSLVCHSQEFLWDTRNGVDYVALRWDKLRDRAPRVCWILYELGADSIKKAVLADEVRKVYSRYAKRFGIDDELPTATLLNVSQREKCWKPYPLGKTKFWMNRESEKFEFDLDEYARQYLQNHPGDLEGFMKQAEDDGYTNLYKERKRIAGAFYNVGEKVGKRKIKDMSAGKINYSDSEKEERLLFAKQIIEDNAGPMFQRDLVNEIRINYPSLKDQTLRSWIKKDNRFIYSFAKNGEKSAIISIAGMQEGHQPRTYRQKIKDEAVKYLFNKNDYTEDKKVVYDYFRKDIPEGINSDSALSAIFGDKDLFNRDDSTIRLTEYIKKEEQAKAPSKSDTLEPKTLNLNKLYTPSYEWESLKPMLYKELHAEFRIDPSFNLEENLDKMFDIMACHDKSVPNDASFHWLLSYLPDFFNKVLADDRKVALRNNCGMCLEPFFKTYYKLKFGRDLIEDVKHDCHIYDNSVGLGKICEYFEDNLMILPYKRFVPIDSVDFKIKTYIKRCVNESKTKRNVETGHVDYYIDTSEHSVMYRVCDVFSVFVYIASKY